MGLPVMKDVSVCARRCWKQYLRQSTYCLFLAASTFLVNAEPLISNVTVVDGGSGASSESGSRTYQTATRVKISGTGFGEKVRGGPPILWDRVQSFRGIDGSYRYAEGVGEIPFENGSIVDRDDLRQPWTESSYAGLYGKEDSNVYVKAESEALDVKVLGDGLVRRVVNDRAKDSSGHYVVNGPQGFLGKPREYGGRNPPAGSDYLYVSWWIKQRYNPTRMSNYTLNYEIGTFSPGDTFLVEGTKYTGRVLGFPTNTKSYASLVFSDRAIISAKALGKRLIKTGSAGEILTGGEAVVAIPTSPYTSDGANKFLRVWDNPDGKNFRLSWTATELAFGTVSNGAPVPNKWYTWPGVEEQWNHAELEIDLKSLVLRAWVNNELFVNVSLASAARDKDFSPTVSLLGWDGQYQYYQLTEFGDIYFDNSLQRVVVSNRPTWSEASVSPFTVATSSGSVKPRLKEVQYPVRWTDTEIEAEIYVGAYDHCAVDGLYLFVADASGSFNETGYKLPGKACPVAPKIL